LNIDCTDPHDDRDKIVAVKTTNGRIIVASCEWITTHSLYRSWEDVRTSSQLLWISSAEQRGKTMMACHLSMELEKSAKQNNNTVLYFFIDRQDKRDTAMHVLRGLLSRLLRVRQDLTHHLLEEFEVQKEALFSKDAIEALWRVFIKMITDPIAGQVYCIIDGLDYCTDDSLRRLISRIMNFFRDEPQAVVDDGFGTPAYNPSKSGSSSEQRRTEQRRAAGLKMILVSRDKPDWMVGQLADTHRIDIGVRGRKSGDATQSAMKPAKRPPTLASVAASVMHQQRLNRNNDVFQPKSPTESQLATQSIPSPLNSAYTQASTFTQPPTSVPSSTPSARAPALMSGPPETRPWECVVSGTSFVPHTQVSGSNGSEYALSNDPRTNPRPDTRTGYLSPSLPARQSPANHDGFVAAPPPPFVSQHFNEPPSHEYKQSDADYRDDVKAEAVGNEEESGDTALRLYIEAKLEDSCAERQYPTEVQSYIIAALEYRGDDTFLWVDFAIEEIRKATASNIEAMVNSLPPTLTEMYSFILLRIPADLVGLVAGLLRWVVCAREPLKILDLTITLGLTSHGSGVAENLVRTAVSACGNMLTENPKDKSINIVHNSVVDFLSHESSPIRNDSRLAPFVIHASQAHHDIANFCVAYLEAGCLKDGPICRKEKKDAYNQRLAQYPFMPYAASFWPHHFRDAGDVYINLSSPFFEPKSKVRKNWWITYWSFSTGKSNWTAPRDFTLLHLASYVDLVCLVQQLRQRGDLQPRLDKRDSHGTTALEYAVVKGHMGMFQFLIGAGASQKGIDENLLELACRTGQRDIAAQLIKMGYNVNVRAQTISIKESVYLMARWLPGVVSQGLDINRDIWSYYLMRDIGEQETPLSRAAMFGHSAVIELLLDHHADVNAGTTKCFTPLHAASYQGHTECVEILVTRGASATIQTVEKWLPLHFAAVRGKLDVVEIFLDMGIPLEAMTVKLKTALHLASYSGHADVVRALFDRGANLELRSHKGETPLQLATRSRKPQIVELLLSFGAKRDVVDNEGKTPLNLVEKSTSTGAKECLRILQTFGMAGYQQWQPSAENNTGATADDVSEISVDGTAPPRRDSTIWTPDLSQRSFAPLAAPASYPFQGFQAEFTLSGQYQASRNPYMDPRHPTDQRPLAPQMNQGVSVQVANQWSSSLQQPNLNRVQSEPIYDSSRSTYDAKATTQDYQSRQYQRDEAPPPYNQFGAENGVQTAANFPEKLPSGGTPNNTFQQGAWQHSAPTQASEGTPAIPLQTQGLYSTPTTEYTSTYQQPARASVVQMINAMSLNTSSLPTTPSTAYSQPFAQPPPIATASHNPQTGYPGAQSPTPSLPVLQTPIPPTSPPLHPATAPATTPFHPPPPAQLQHPPPFQPSPQQQFAQHRSQTVPIVHAPHQYQHPHPYPPVYPPSPHITTPPQQPFSHPPVQSPYFSGNSTASTYNASYPYSAPPVTQPYNPGLGASGNGLLFAPPPTQDHGLKKRKSFLGGLMR
jgi:ankyrin repeat protein